MSASVGEIAHASQSTTAAGLFPVGEGAGCAGGIVSAAVDGMITAEWIVRYYATPT